MDPRPANDDFDPGKAGLVRLALSAPPLPSTLVAARSIMAASDAASRDAVLAMVRNDPVVVAQLLKVANAAHYGSRRTVDSLARAVDILGAVTVLGIVTGMNVLRGRMTLDPDAAACYMRLVRHSIATAHIAAMIHERVGPTGLTTETAFTAGLLHDLGRILLVHHEPDHAVAVFDRPEIVVATDPAGVLEVEQMAFGFDHVEAGEYVARKMDFPDAIVDAVRLHHHPPGDTTGTAALLVRTVAAADVAASAFGYAFSLVRSPEQCESHPVWDSLPVSDPLMLLADVRAFAAGLGPLSDAPVQPPRPIRRHHDQDRSPSPRSARD